MAKQEKKLFESNEERTIRESLNQMEDAWDIADVQYDQSDYDLIGESALADMDLDPRSRDAQLEALEMISDLADDGMTAQDEAILNRINREQNMQNRMAQESILQQANRRGTLGSGSQQAQQMLAQQAGADRAALQGLEAAGQASARRQGAVGQMAGQAGNLRQQDYGQASDLANARDRISQFNTDTRNKQLDRNNLLAQQAYDNRIKKAGGLSNAYSQQRQAAQDKIKQDLATYEAISGTATTIGGQIMEAYGKKGG